jgi:hypothetical protein
MAKTLAARGVQYELMTLPTLGHAFDSAVNAEESGEVRAVFEQVVEFLLRHV